MAHTWRTIRLFISSTFRDIHAERDHLVRVVFPELKERCRKHRVHLIDVDLRWGVSEADVQDGKALDICLDEIDSCRPYFLGLLGHRYGWIPEGQRRSITAQEIYHAVLHNEIPKQIVDLRQIIEGRLEGKALVQEQVECLGRCYLWHPDKNKYLLKPNAPSADLESIRSIFRSYSAYQRDRSFFFFRSESFTRELAGQNSEDFFETDEGDRERLAALKQEIVDAGLPWFEYHDLETFGQQVLDRLWSRIEAELGQPGEAERDWLEEEVVLHELFMADRTRRFVGRRALLDRIQTFCEGEAESSVLVVTGEPGAGKSALMAKSADEMAHRHPEWMIIPHFVGASPSSTNLRQMLKRLCALLNALTGELEEIPEETKELIKVFPDLLAKASEDRKIVIILDAVNQLEKIDNSHDMRWLPLRLSESVKVVISTLPGEALDALLKRSIKPQVEAMTGLTTAEIKALVTDYLKEIRHEFPNRQVEQTFLNRVATGTPLYILVALEELKLVGRIDDLAVRVDGLPDNVSALFAQVLARIESDFTPALVRDYMSYIACGRYGMTAEELQTLLRVHAPKLGSDTEPQKLPDMLWARLYRAFKPYLFERSGVIDFFHGQLKEAAGIRYLHDEGERKAVRKIIADYFENRWREPCTRALEELPHQRTNAEDWEGVEQVLTDLRFIEAKCMLSLVYDLMADYKAALDRLPEAQEERRKERDDTLRIRKYTSDLIAYAKSEIQTLDIIPSVEPRSEEKIRQEMDRIIDNPTRLDRIEAFSQFVSAEKNMLAKFANLPGFCFQQAYNSAQRGPVVTAAERAINAVIDTPFLLMSANSRSVSDPHPSLLGTLEGHTSVESICITPDGRRALSGSWDKTLRLWDLETGTSLKTLEGHTQEINTIGITPDGRRGLSGSKDKTMRLWDLETGLCLKTMEGHSDSVESVSITPDGRRALSASLDNTLRLWNLETGTCLRTLELKGERLALWMPQERPTSQKMLEWQEIATRFVNTIRSNSIFRPTVSITPDGHQAIVVSNVTLHVWDLDSGTCLKTLPLEGHSECVNGISITPDGGRALSGSSDKTLRLWDLKTGMCLKTLVGHTKQVRCVSITADGRLGLSGSLDRTLRLWELDTGTCLKTFEGHSYPVESVSITPDGRRAVTGSGDVLLWNLETSASFGTSECHMDVVNSVGITPNGRHALSGSGDKTLRLWELKTGAWLKTLEGHTDKVSGISITPDGSRALTASWDKTLRLWDLETGTCLKTLEGHTDLVGGVSITPDGRRALSWSGNGWDFNLGLWDVDSGIFLKAMEGHAERVAHVSITPDGRLGLSASDKTLRLLDLDTGTCLKTLEGHTDTVYRVSITPDARLALSSSGNRDKTLCLWDLKTGALLRSVLDHMHGSWVACITPEGKRAICVGLDGALRVWDLRTGIFIKEVKGQQHSSSMISVTPDGRWALSGGLSYNTLGLWNLENDSCQPINLDSRGKVYSISEVHPTGLYAYGTIAGRVATVAIVNVSLGTPVITAQRFWQHGGHEFHGCWDDRITAVCKWCGSQFVVTKETMDVINAINRAAALADDYSPCLELPPEAWDEPRLLSECPHCYKPLKFNPFIVDNRDRY